MEDEGWRMDGELARLPCSICYSPFSFLVPGTATMALLALFDHFFGKSSQVPLHEAFTHKTGFPQSSLIKANQGKSSYFCE
jgi:hypothetical protein